MRRLADFAKVCSYRYVEETSEWTLDYPPLFAWFQRLLAYPAALLDPATLYISKLPYKSPECVLFQVGLRIRMGCLDDSSCLPDMNLQGFMSRLFTNHNTNYDTNLANADTAIGDNCMHGLQRLSVVFTDAVLLSGLWLATRRRCGSQKKVTRYMVAANAGLLIVDHIHFQYNGLLLGTVS